MDTRRRALEKVENNTALVRSSYNNYPSQYKGL